MAPTTSYRDWQRFNGKNVPGTMYPSPVFFEQVRRGFSIADIGCGAGRVCFDLLSKGYGPLTGFDQNENCIRFAREKLERLPEEQQKKCRFEMQDALQTSFTSQTFQAGIILAVLTTLTTPADRLRTLREARRIIQKGGGLYIGEFIQTWHHPVYYERYLRGEKETGELGSFLGKNKSGDISFQAHHFSERELVDLLHQAEFEIKHWEYNTVTTQNGNQINGAAIWVE